MDVSGRSTPPRSVTLDLAAARRHLELAKQELGVDAIPPLVLLTDDTPVANKQAEYFQNLFMRTLGLEIKIDKQIFKQRLAKMTSGDFDMVSAGWGPDYDDPLTFGDLFASWNGNNRGKYNNPELDRQVRIAQSSLDPANKNGRLRRDPEDPDRRCRHPARTTSAAESTSRIPDLKGVVHRAVGTDPDYTNAYLVEDP